MVNYIDSLLLNKHSAIYLFISMFVIALSSWFVLSPEAVINLTDENGPVESLTVILYILPIIVLWRYKFYNAYPIKTYYAANILIFSMMFREMDLHKYISGISMFKLRFWTGNYPLTEKLFALVIIAIIATALIYLFKTYHSVCLSNIKHRKNNGITFIAFFITLVTSKIIDRSLNMITEISGWHAEIWMRALQVSVEEWLELSLPLFILLYIYQMMHPQEVLINRPLIAKHYKDKKSSY